jgi:hypothetical protein
MPAGLLGAGLGMTLEMRVALTSLLLASMVFAVLIGIASP